MSDEQAPQRGSRLYQVSENDLATLERTLPEIAEVMMGNLSPRLRVQWRQVQTILSKIRWNYGPPEHVERIEAP